MGKKDVGLTIKGTLHYDAKAMKVPFAAIGLNSLITGELTNAEIVVYGYILIHGYKADARRVIYTDGITALCRLVNITKNTVTAALKSLIDKKMIKQVKAGYTAKKTSGRYLMVASGFLISKDTLTTSQKAFLLRIAALKEAGIIEEEITKTDTSESLSLSRPTVNKIVTELAGLNVKWITITNKSVTINFSVLKDSLLAEFSERLQEVERLPTKVQLKYKINTPSTKKPRARKSRLIQRIEVLEATPGVRQREVIRAKKYIDQSRLQNAERVIFKEEERLGL